MAAPCSANKSDRSWRSSLCFQGRAMPACDLQCDRQAGCGRLRCCRKRICDRCVTQVLQLNYQRQRWHIACPFCRHVAAVIFSFDLKCAAMGCPMRRGVASRTSRPRLRESLRMRRSPCEPPRIDHRYKEHSPTLQEVDLFFVAMAVGGAPGKATSAGSPELQRGGYLRGDGRKEVNLS